MVNVVYGIFVIILGILLIVFSKSLTTIFRAQGIRYNKDQDGVKIRSLPSAKDMFGEKIASWLIKLFGLFGIIMGALLLMGIISGPTV